VLFLEKPASWKEFWTLWRQLPWTRNPGQARPNLPPPLPPHDPPPPPLPPYDDQLWSPRWSLNKWKLLCWLPRQPALAAVQGRRRPNRLVQINARPCYGQSPSRCSPRTLPTWPWRLCVRSCRYCRIANEFWLFRCFVDVTACSGDVWWIWGDSPITKSY